MSKIDFLLAGLGLLFALYATSAHAADDPGVIVTRIAGGYVATAPAGIDSATIYADGAPVATLAGGQSAGFSAPSGLASVVVETTACSEIAGSPSCAYSAASVPVGMPVFVPAVFFAK